MSFASMVPGPGAKRNRTSYQKMIRRVVDFYAIRDQKRAWHSNQAAAMEGDRGENPEEKGTFKPDVPENIPVQ